MYTAMIHMTDIQVCIPSEEGPEIVLKHVVKNTMNTTELCLIVL
jgi:hypothetical protein